MPHILFIYKQFPAPGVGHAGGESLFYLMRALHQRGWRISLVARICDEESRDLAEIRDMCETIVTVRHHRSIPGLRPIAWIRSYLALRRAARNACREIAPDCVHVETTQTALALAGLSLPPSSFRTQDVNWYMAEQAMQHEQGMRRSVTGVVRTLFRWLEPRLYDRYDLILAISKGDLALLELLLPQRRLYLVPLRGLARQERQPAIDSAHVVLFAGAMSRHHNVRAVLWFLDAIWPEIKSRVPDAAFYIVGRNPPEQIVACADGQSVFVTGFVDDLYSWYAAADVFVSPMLVAGGLLQKVVDAMSLGVPVVSTSVCNHGIGAREREEIILADDAASFADAVVELLSSPEHAKRLRERALTYITTVYDFEAAIDHWDDALRQLIADQPEKVIPDTAMV